MGAREAIIAAARSEVGQVSDVGGEHGNKLGWEHLKAYFEAAFGDNDIFARGRAYRDGIMQAGQFVTGPGANGPASIDWCGIFCVWALRQAGIDARWTAGSGPTGRIKDDGVHERSARSNFQDMMVGDILVRHHSVHHASSRTAAARGSSRSGASARSGSRVQWRPCPTRRRFRIHPVGRSS